MKKIAIQLISSSVALAVMAGGAGLHWWKVKKMEVSGAGAKWVSLAVERPAPDEVMLTSAGPQTPDGTQGPGQPKAELNAIVATMEEMVSVLKDLRSENDDLREQVREINLDLNEATLRLDSHSESFRPLKVSPGIEALISPEHPLLPRKDR